MLKSIGFCTFVAAAISCQPTTDSPPAPASRLPIEARPRVDPSLAPPITPTITPTITPMQLASEPVAAPHEVAAPWSLTASDGSGLQLTRVDAKAVVEGPLAFTELHLYFHNPEDRTREGTFAITLPSGAAVSRFAMETNQQWQEAELVEKQLARRIYDDYLHRKQDPALLEKAAGNQFSAKVFPIAARSDKHLVVSFSQELAGRAYALPLRGLPKIARVDVALVTTGLDGAHGTQTLGERDWQADRDFVANVPTTAAAVAAGTFVVGAFALDRATGPGPDVPKALSVLVDTSASRALGYAGYVRSIHAMIAAIRAAYGDPVQLQVIAFDQDAQRIFDGVAADYGDAQDRALIARGAAGASDLGVGLAALGAGARRRVVVVTDGVVTAGADTPALIETIKHLPIDRLDVVLAGGLRDERLAASIARAGLPHAGDVYDLDRGAQAVTVGLGQPVMVDVAIEIPGATWVYPRILPAARPGSSQLVFARMAAPVQSIDLKVGGVTRTLGLGTATPALIERAVAGAEIEELENTLARADDATAKTLRADIARRSIAARVISSQTSMLVLESDADYARYKIDRTTLADLLVVGPAGLEQRHRTQLAIAAPPASPTATDQDTRQTAIDHARTAGVLGASGDVFKTVEGTGDLASGLDGELQGGFGYGRAGFGPGGGGAGSGEIGTGRYGTIGAGNGTGYGVGGGRGGMRGRTALVPTITLETPAVDGSLDRAIIRRYIRRNTQKIQYCYEKQLLVTSTLTGTVTTQFTILPDGTVGASTAAGLDPTVAACIAGVIKEIAFPRPTSGAVRVSYPFTFRRLESSDPAPDPTPARAAPPEPEPASEPDRGPPLTGKLADVMQALAQHDVDKAYAVARAWHDEAPGDVLALIALGEALEARRDLPTAARIYGSIIDLYSTRADFRRFAGERLERLGPPYRKLVIDTYRRAVADRKDHVTGHRLLAYALLRDGDHAGAFAAILAGIDEKYPDDRFSGAARVLREDAGMIAAAYLANGGTRDDVLKQLPAHGATLATTPSTRFVMYWETDANDVDFHIRDRRGGHAWYSSMTLPSGGELYADITTGYGRSASRSRASRRRRPTSSRSTTTRRAPWATAWGCSRSSASTARS
ncbi:MAG: AgmX/PglI C-terminal domain-containing protein [Proteobacteria bacterium]|nr:AgmX/PglI C-terminal domain-containing protein [Pseudomonadota bacterium]